MNSTLLYQKFSSSLGWNGFLFAVQKSLSTIVSSLLFWKLTTNDFSLWAIINSSIYLLILWLDLGLSKSVPRYAPVFARNLYYHRYFTKVVCAIQIIALTVIGIPWLIYYTKNFAPILIGMALSIFISEGLVKVLRLIYHAQFHNKQFNLYNTATISVETGANLLSIVLCKNSYQLLIAILAAKLICSVALAACGLYGLSSLYTDKDYPDHQPINIGKTAKECVKHSLIMAVTTFLTSLSERNFLILFFNRTLGAEATNIFKIANDWALLFYRMLIKTIGTNDTALFAHVETMPNRKELLPDAFKNVATKIASLCIPLLGVLALFLSSNIYDAYNPLVFKLFCIIAISYMIEALFSMYERVLEVKRAYVMLAFSYLPYIAIIALLFLVSCLGIVESVLFIQAVRLVQVLLCIYCVRTYYALQFPVRFVARLALLVAPVCLVVHFLLPFFYTLVVLFSSYIRI